MSEKMTCPACDSHTSKVLSNFQLGMPCPYCGLPAEAAMAVEKARDAHVAEDVIQRLIDLEGKCAKLADENRRLTARHREIIECVSKELDEYPSMDDVWG